MTLSPAAVRLLTAAVFTLTALWLIMLAAGAWMASGGAPITWEMWMTSLFPGCAVAPALFYLLRRRTTSDPQRQRKFTGTAVMLTLMGFVLFGSTAYNLVQMYPR